MSRESIDQRAELSGCRVRGGNWFALAAIILLCLPAFGQAAYTGDGARTGEAVFGSPGWGSPLTYNARIDNCVHGFGSAYAESGCVNGRTTGEAGSALAYQEGSGDPLPFARLDSTTPALMNTSFTDADFGAYSVFATDQANPCGSNLTVYTMGSEGNYDAFGTGAPPFGNSNDVLLSPQTSGSVPCFTHVIESRLLAKACSASNACIVPSNVQGASCTPSAVSYTAPFCSHTQISSGSLTFGRNAGDPPNTIFELALPYVYKDTFTSSLDGNGFPTGVSDSVARTLYVDLSSDTGGSLPCSIIAADYNSNWNGVFQVSNAGAFTLASGGGSPWHATTSYTTDNFISPVNNVTVIANFMFQATTAGTSGVTEPNWGVSCPAPVNTCADGTITWTNIGKVKGQGPGFDLFHFDPARGCRRMNTRLTKTYNGTNEGANWPAAGPADLAGQWITDDATICYRMGGTNCGSGGTVNLTDRGTLHDSGNYLQSRYGRFTPTGAGSRNTNYPGGGGDPTMSLTGNGSCTPTIGWTAFYGWPASGFVSGTAYSNGVYVSSPVDHNYYQLTGATGTYTIDPSADATNWQYNSYYCYIYITDWYSNVLRPDLELGPHFGGDAHASVGYGLDFRGGKYYSHFLSQPNCPNTSGTCAGQYVGAPNPGVAALTLSLPSDGHPSYRNDGTQDLQPIFDPTTGVPSQGGVGLVRSAAAGRGALVGIAPPVMTRSSLFDRRIADTLPLWAQLQHRVESGIRGAERGGRGFSRRQDAGLDRGLHGHARGPWNGLGKLR